MYFGDRMWKTSVFARLRLEITQYTLKSSQKQQEARSHAAQSHQIDGREYLDITWQWWRILYILWSQMDLGLCIVVVSEVILGCGKVGWGSRGVGLWGGLSLWYRGECTMLFLGELGKCLLCGRVVLMSNWCIL